MSERDLSELAAHWRAQEELLRQSVAGHSRKHDLTGSIDRNLAMADMLARHANDVERHRCQSEAEHPTLADGTQTRHMTGGQLGVTAKYPSLRPVPEGGDPS